MSKVLAIIAVASLLVLCLPFTSGYPSFQEEIPNGNRVPNPCSPTTIWEGVGHEDHRGGGPRNKFGLDFFNAGKKWTEDLCRKDSDGDGKTNGEELGDPKCVWTKGATPAITDSSKLQHPGVCEPLTSPSCAVTNSFLKECDALGLTTPSPSAWCPSTTSSDVKTTTIRFHNATLSAEETLYVCQQYDLPSDQFYHLIAWEPIIDNRKILHHMVMYACDNNQEQYLAKAPMYTPTQCRMTPQCSTMIVVWAYGINGQCYPSDVGAPFGKGQYKTVILQMHYNNDAKVPGYVDSSGLKLYYTSVRRPSNKGLVAFGDMYLIIPPKTRYYQIPPAVLTSDCTKRIFQPAASYNLISMLIHIHRQGTFAQVVLDKKKAGYKILILNDTFTYDRPQVAQWNAPYEITMEPGDEVSISCGFNTLDKDDWTFFGSRTSDEMCFAFMDIYTRPIGANFLLPANMGPDMDWCATAPKGEWIVKGCDFNNYVNRSNLVYGEPPERSTVTMDILNACACWGADNYPVKVCSSACYSVMQKHDLFNEPCISDDVVWQLLMRAWYDDAEILHRSQSQMAVCQSLTAPPPSGQLCSAHFVVEDDKGGAAQQTASLGLLLFATAVVLFRPSI